MGDKFLKWVLILAAIAIPAGCGHGTDIQADVQALQENEKQWNLDFASRDVEKIVGHYADDAILMATAMPASSGKETIRTALKQMMTDPAMTLKFAPSKIEVSKSGELGYTRGSYEMTVTDPQSKKVVHDHGSYVTTYRKGADGKWMAVADIASSEVATSTTTGAM